MSVHERDCLFGVEWKTDFRLSVIDLVPCTRRPDNDVPGNHPLSLVSRFSAQTKKIYNPIIVVVTGDICSRHRHCIILHENEPNPYTLTKRTKKNNLKH